MCRSMADIRSTAAEIRRGKKEEEDRRKEGKKLQGKNIMAPLLHRAAIITAYCSLVRRVRFLFKHHRQRTSHLHSGKINYNAHNIRVGQ